MSDQTESQHPEIPPQPEAVVQAPAAPSKPFPTKAVLIGLAVVVLIVAAWAAGGRKYQARPGSAASGPDRAHQQAWNEELLPIAMDKFNRLEEFVEAEMLNQAIDQFDQWAQGQRPLQGWQVDPMVAVQPRLIAAVPDLKDLDKLSFSRADILAIEEAVILRDLSAWARGEQVDDLERAKHLFDWTVRNVQLHDPRSQQIPQRPFETLLWGSGTAIDRAWVFILLCRQQGLDAVMLAVRDPSDSSKRRFVQWLPAVLLGKDLYPFMVDMGLPIPAKGGVKRDEAGQLDIQPATLAELAADESLLRQLAIDPTHPYPVKADDVKEVMAMVEASPAYLTQRLKMVESRLAGKEKLVLSTSPSALAARLKGCKQVVDVRLWDIPYQVILDRIQNAMAVVQWQQGMMGPFRVGRSPWLLKGRILYLKGKLTGEPNAAEMYQHARPSDRELDLANMDTGSRLLYRIAKINASYWLGLVAAEQANYRAAVDYFAKRTIEATPGGPWTHGAKYNLGRVYEAMGQPEKAIHEYESDVGSPGLFGNLFRARLLGSKTAHLPPAFSAGSKSAPSSLPAAKPADKPAKPADKPAKPADKPAKPADKPAEKKPASPVSPAVKPVEKSESKPVPPTGKAPESPAEKKAATPEKPAAAGGKPANSSPAKKSP